MDDIIVSQDCNFNDYNILSFKNIEVKNVTKSLMSKIRGQEVIEKKILDNISGQFKSGRLCALMGSSGSGKTSLMNVLSDNVPRSLKYKGKIRYNGQKLKIRKISSYIQQIDLFYIRFTVKEHLEFHIKLYSGKYSTEEQRKIIFSDLVTKFSLEKCLNTIIGDGIRVMGLSGGERKRLSIASEVVKYPQIVFADEPTSGLDIYMASSVINSLKILANQGAMVVVTIHQPSFEIFKHFDDVCLISAGRLVALNTLPSILTIFENAGFPCPLHHNPADFIIYSTTLFPDDEENCSQRIKLIEESANVLSVKYEDNVEIELSSKNAPIQKKQRVSQFFQLKELLRRDFTNIIREPLFFYVRLIQNIISALLCGLIFFQLKFSATLISNIFGILFFFATTFTFQNVFSIINVFPTEVDIFTRDNRKKLYRHTPYFISKLLTEIPVTVLFVFVFTIISYFLIGLRLTVEAFFLTILVLILVAEISISYAYLITTLVPDIKAAPAIASSILLIFLLLGGFLLSSNQIPVYIAWVSYLSSFKYAIEALAIIQLKNNVLLCDNPLIEYCKNNETISATFSFSSLGYSEDNLVQDFLCLLALFVGYRLFAYFALTYRAKRR